MARLSTRIDAHLVRRLFNYNPTTGKLTVKDEYKHLPVFLVTGRSVFIYNINYSLHNLVYAWHNPDEPQPQWVKFIDGNPKNTRIENLYPLTKDKNWIVRSRGGIKCHMDDMGNITRIYDSEWMPDFRLTECPHCKKELYPPTALPNDTTAYFSTARKSNPASTSTAPAPTENGTGFEDFDAELEAEMNKLRFGL